MVRGPVVLRCDGDATIGAGHVGRCLPIAAAIRRAGGEALFAGSYAALAADCSPSRASRRSPRPTRPRHPATARAALIDSYAIGPEAIARAAADRPVLAFCDTREVPDLGAAVRLELTSTPPGTG